MAKIKDLKFTFQGEEIKKGINCNSGGVFSVNLPVEVATALKLDNTIKGESLDAVEKSFWDALTRYKNAETKQDLYILIRYGSNGVYSKYEDGKAFDYAYRSPYHFNSDLDAIGFIFLVAIKETVDGVSTWYKAKPGPEGTFKKDGFSNTIYDYKLKEYKVIPFTPAALDVLTKGRENLRKISEGLFKFITQDEEKLISGLNSGKLLN